MPLGGFSLSLGLCVCLCVCVHLCLNESEYEPLHEIRTPSEIRAQDSIIHCLTGLKDLKEALRSSSRGSACLYIMLVMEESFPLTGVEAVTYPLFNDDKWFKERKLHAVALQVPPFEEAAVR